jgi:hypothetical protein
MITVILNLLLHCIYAAGLLAEVESKAGRQEYGRLLEECRQLYCSVRQQASGVWQCPGKVCSNALWCMCFSTAPSLGICFSCDCCAVTFT